jgi:hypothetical protein
LCLSAIGGTYVGVIIMKGEGCNGDSTLVIDVNGKRNNIQMLYRNALINNILSIGSNQKSTQLLQSLAIFINVILQNMYILNNKVIIIIFLE